MQPIDGIKYDLRLNPETITTKKAFRAPNIKPNLNRKIKNKKQKIYLKNKNTKKKPKQPHIG